MAVAKARICIVSPFAYGALMGGRTGHAGGVEQQTTLSARWLAARGHGVDLVTWDEGQSDGEMLHGIRLLKMRRRDAGSWGLRFFQRWRSLVAALRRSNADVYYVNCGDYVTGQVSAWCTWHGRRFVYSVASDPDCDRRLPKLPLLRERLLYRYGLSRAHTVVVQTNKQRAMLTEHFARRSTVLPMPCPPLQNALSPAARDRQMPPKARVIWIGRISPVKRFDILLEIARRMPDVQFETAGKPDSGGEYATPLLEQARQLPNLVMHGLVGRDQLPPLYYGATALLCTSDYEGFPNTFLEAWSFGTPVVSTVDPDGLITSRGLGVHVAGIDDTVAALRALVASPDRWKACSAAGFDYVTTHHQPDEALVRLERVLFEDSSTPDRVTMEPAAPAVAGTPVSVCFIAHPAWGEMSGGKVGEIGGIQRQLSMMARWFARRGHTVTMLVWDEGQADEVMVDGVRVIKMCRRDEGVPVLRFVYPRWTSLLQAMRRANAQVYYQNTAEYVTGQAADWCRRNGRSFVFSVANDWDCETAAIKRRPFRERTLYTYGLKHADAVIAQTRTQQRILREEHGVASTVIPMPSPPTGNGEVTPPQLDPPRVVWVGRIAEAKRLEMLFDIAQRAPDIQFEVAGVPNPPGAYADALVERGKQLPNVRMLGRVERDDIPALYRSAVCLLCTSVHEGFPNTFLESWSQGVPVVSSFDPDGLIADLELGGVGDTAEALLAAVRRLIASPEAWQATSARGQDYYQRNHLPENVVPRFEQVFGEVAARGR